MTYTLPKGWNGGGAVQWDTRAEYPVNVCVRTMELGNDAKNLKAHYISSFETPIRGMTTDAGELARLLEPAVRKLPGFTLGATAADSRLMQATEEVREFRLGRDRLRRALGDEVDGEVYLLVSSYDAMHTDPETGALRPCNILCGAVVHERSTQTAGRRRTTASFHDIFIIGGPTDASPMEETLSELRRTLTTPKFNRRWMQTHIRTMANAIDGMPKVDDQALRRVGEKAEEGIRLGLPTVLGVMEAESRPAAASAEQDGE